MQRFYNNPKKAQGKFSRSAYKIHPLNLKGAFIRGGIRL